MIDHTFIDRARAELDELGFTIVDDIIPAAECNRLSGFLEPSPDGRAGSRALLEKSSCRELADTISRHPRVASLLSPAMAAVQCTLFEKSPANNWLVAFHQDQSIPVAARIASEHCRGWGRKGWTHVILTEPTERSA